MIKNLGNLFDVNLPLRRDDDLRFSDALKGLSDEIGEGLSEAERQEISVALQDRDDDRLSQALRNSARRRGKMSWVATEVERTSEELFRDPNETKINPRNRLGRLTKRGVGDEDLELIANIDLQPDASSVERIWKTSIAKAKAWRKLNSPSSSSAGSATSGNSRPVRRRYDDVPGGDSLLSLWAPLSSEEIEVSKRGADAYLRIHKELSKLRQWLSYPLDLDINPRLIRAISRDSDVRLPIPASSIDRSSLGVIAKETLGIPINLREGSASSDEPGADDLGEDEILQGDLRPFEETWNSALDGLWQGFSWGAPEPLRIGIDRVSDSSRSIDGRPPARLPIWACKNNSRLSLPPSPNEWRDFRRADEPSDSSSGGSGDVAGEISQALSEVLRSSGDSTSGSAYSKFEALSYFETRQADGRQTSTFDSAFWKAISGAKDEIRWFFDDASEIAIDPLGPQETREPTSEFEGLGIFNARLASWLFTLGRNSALVGNIGALPDRFQEALGSAESSSPDSVLDAAFGRVKGLAFDDERGFPDSPSLDEVLRRRYERLPDDNIRRLHFLEVTETLDGREGSSQTLLFSTRPRRRDWLLQTICSDPEVRFSEGEDWLDDSSETRLELIEFLTEAANAWKSDALLSALEEALEKHFDRISDLSTNQRQVDISDETKEAALAHWFLMVALDDVRSRRSAPIFRRLAASTFVRWSNVNGSLRRGFNVESGLFRRLKESDEDTRQVGAGDLSGLEISFLTDDDRWADREGSLVEDIPDEERDFDLFRGTEDVNPLRYLARDILGPVFEAYATPEMIAQSPEGEISAGTTKWFGADQAQLWTSLLALLSGLVKSIEERVTPSEGLSGSLALWRGKPSNLVQRKIRVEETRNGGIEKSGFLVVRTGFRGILGPDNPERLEPLRELSELEAKHRKWLFGNAWFVAGLEIEAQRRFAPFLRALEAASKRLEPETPILEQLRGANGLVGQMAALWGTFGHVRPALVRNEVQSRLIEAEKAAKQFIQIYGKGPDPEGAWGQTLSEVPSGFGVLPTPSPVISQGSEDQPYPSDDVELVKPEQSPFLTLLGGLLRETGIRDFDVSSSSLNDSRCLVIGGPRDPSWLPESRLFRKRMNWSSFLSGATLRKDFLLDEGIWAIPKVANFHSVVVPEEEATRSVDDLLQKWFEFWTINSSGGDIKPVSRSYREMREAFEESYSGGTEERAIESFRRALGDAALSECLLIWNRLVWGLDVRPSALIERNPDAWTELNEAEISRRRLLAERVFPRVWALPWSGDYFFDSSRPGALNQASRVLWDVPDGVKADVPFLQLFRLGRREGAAEIEAAEVQIESEVLLGENQDWSRRFSGSKLR